MKSIRLTLLKQPSAWACACLLFVHPVAAAAPPGQGGPAAAPSARVRCATDSRRVEGMRASRSFIDALTASFSSENCNSVLSVLALLVDGEVEGGRKLRTPGTLDPQAAASEREAAHADPAFARGLAAALEGETHPLRRQLIEAAQLDAFGSYAARDLVIQQIRSQAGGTR